MTAPRSIYDIAVARIGGDEIRLGEFRGKVMLIVNTASNCGFTPQYAGLETLHRQFRDRGLVILGFPCNQFGEQEPGDETAIADFCQSNYGVSFPMFAKIDVNGDAAHPLYVFLKSHAKGLLGSELIKWNFTKFLVDRDGVVVKRYASITKPDELTSDIDMLL